MPQIPTIDLYPDARAFDQAVSMMRELDEMNLTEGEELPPRELYEKAMREFLAIHIDQLLEDMGAAQLAGWEAAKYIYQFDKALRYQISRKKEG